MPKVKNTLTLTEINELFYAEDSKLKWKVSRISSKRKIGDIAGTDRDGFYKQVGIDFKQYLVHRILYQIYNGIENLDNSVVVDHINHIPSDNRKENLRVAEFFENSANRVINYNSTSGIKGINKVKQTNKYGDVYYYWRASFNHLGKVHKKNFEHSQDGLEKAKEWLTSTRLEICGEFACDG